MLLDIENHKIKTDKNISKYFTNATFSNLSVTCNILEKNFLQILLLFSYY